MSMTEEQDRKVERRGLMRWLTALCVRYVERLMPDPYLFAVILTALVVGLIALLVRGATPSGVLKAPAISGPPCGITEWPRCGTSATPSSRKTDA